MIITPQTKIKNMSLKEKVALVKKSDGYLIDILKWCGFTEHLSLDGLKNLKHTPEGLRVYGNLYLFYCTNLKKISGGLIVSGSLYLDSCVNLEELPEDLKVGGSLYLEGCSSLKEIPKNIKVGTQIVRPKHLVKNVL